MPCYCLRRAARSDRSDVFDRAKQCGMVGQGTREGEVFARCGWAENGLGELSVAFVTPRFELGVEAAAAGL